MSAIADIRQVLSQARINNYPYYMVERAISFDELTHAALEGWRPVSLILAPMENDERRFCTQSDSDYRGTLLEYVEE